MKRDVRDILLDEENHEPIVLWDEQKKETHIFEQIAVIPYRSRIYAVLKPITPFYPVAENEALVFYVNESAEDSRLCIENNIKIARRIFREYRKLVRRSMRK